MSVVEPVRAFLAFELPERVRSQLAAAREELKRELPQSRWTRPEGWHLTLKFLGETRPPVMALLAAGLSPRIHGLGGVRVELGGAGFFPTSVRPRVAWVGGTARGAERVVTAVEEAAEAAGFARERRQWSVHLTQARLKSQWPQRAVDRFLEWGSGLDLEAFVCREVALLKSDLRPGGAVYTALERFPLE